MQMQTIDRTLSDTQLLDSVLNSLGADGPTLCPAKPAAPKTRGWILPGFHGKARVETSFGMLPVEALRRNDVIRTRSGRFATVINVDRILLDDAFLGCHPEAHPMLIRALSINGKAPARDVLLSPSQPIIATDASRGTNTTVPSDLTSRPGIVRNPQGVISYYLFHCAEPIYANVEGLWCKVEPK